MQEYQGTQGYFTRFEGENGMDLTRSVIRSKVKITSFPRTGDASVQMAFLLRAKDKAPFTLQRSRNSLLHPSNPSAPNLYDTVDYANELQS